MDIHVCHWHQSATRSHINQQEVENSAIDCAAYNTFHSVSSDHKIVTIKGDVVSEQIIEGVKQKQLPAVIIFVDFSKAFYSIDRSKMEQILETYGIPNEIIKAIMIIYKNTQVFVRSPDVDTEFFNIIAGVLQGDTLAPYLFIIVLHYILRNVDQNKNLGFTLRKQLSRRYPAEMLTEAGFADD